jgi:ParB family chromosome partitioning protein
MKSTAINGEYRDLPIAILTESPTNPRKRFDEKALEELAASFKTQGVLEPLLVRQIEEENFQVVIGARRLRAARLAELERVPVRVKKLTDAEAIEAQVVELSVVVKRFLSAFAGLHVV